MGTKQVFFGDFLSLDKKLPAGRRIAEALHIASMRIKVPTRFVRRLSVSRNVTPRHIDYVRAIVLLGENMKVVGVIMLLLGGMAVHLLWVVTTVIRYEWFLAFQLKRIQRNRLKSGTSNANNQ